MITIEMISAALYSFLGLSALNVALTQVLKDMFKTDKRWQNHLLAFITSLVTSGIVLAIGIFNNIGIFAAFCTSCASSWILFAGIVISCTFICNGQWSYEVAKKFLELIGLLTRKPEPEPNKEEEEK